MSRCIACGGKVDRQIRFGRMPLANGFLRQDEFASEFFHELAVGCCQTCSLAQLIDHVAPARMFHDRYPYFSSTSARMQAHFRAVFSEASTHWLRGTDPFVVEIGSNDGVLLQHFARAGVRHLGIEPSGNVAASAREKGVRVLGRFFDETVARDVMRENGQADVIFAANCFCHVRDLDSLAAAVRRLLKPEGRLVFEDPYLGDIIRLGAYDQMYDEHASYFSVLSARTWLARHDLELIDVQPQEVHGGSMRYVVAHRGNAEPAQAVLAMLALESSTELNRPATLGAFQQRIDASRDALVALLQTIRQDNKRVVAYGATSKSTTLLNYCGITDEIIDFVVDNTPDKQGLYTPGAHIPVRPAAAFGPPYPDYALLLAWNHAEEIMAKEAGFARAGGRWLHYVPGVRVSGALA